MPELPEVQCVVNSLGGIIGKSIRAVRVHTTRLREPLDACLQEKLAGQTVTAIERRSKYILIHLGEGCLVVHLGMTGKLLLNADKQKHDHVDIELRDGSRLTYNDARKFGFVVFEPKISENRYLRLLGIEPLSDAFTPQWLYEARKGSRQAMKSFLLDQKKVCGLGNIYVCEVLYLCGISPLRKASQMSEMESAILVREIKKILLKAIEFGGSSISDYRDAHNRQGSFQGQFHVYGRQEDPLGNAVDYIKIGGRGTYWVSGLQS
jgi:formamidopyrimidine-DNA glycosylase